MQPQHLVKDKKLKIKFTIMLLFSFINFLILSFNSIVLNNEI